MKTNKQGPFQESFYHQPAPIRMARRASSNKSAGSRNTRTAKKGKGM